MVPSIVTVAFFGHAVAAGAGTATNIDIVTADAKARKPSFLVLFIYLLSSFFECPQQLCARQVFWESRPGFFRRQ